MKHRVIIIGGGIGGLALAVGLQRRGVDCQVYERAAALREVGSGIVIAPNGIKALDALDPEVGQRVRSAAPPVFSQDPYPFLHASGRVKMSFAAQDIQARWGAPLVPIHRAELHTILKDGLPSTILHTNAKFATLKQDAQGVTAHFESGQSVNGTVLVGADGLRSQVRTQLFGNVAPDYLGITSIRGVVQLEDNPYPQGFLTSGQGIQIFTASLNRNRLYWTATVNAPEGEWTRKSGSQAQADLIQRVRKWHEPVVRMIEQTPLDQLVVTDIYDRPPLPTWSQGLVTLVGDAAHPMSPFQGMGANMALEDAAVLSRLLAECESAQDAFVRYEDVRKARAERVAKESRQIGMMGQWENPFAIWLRDRMMPLMMRFMDTEKQDAWMYQPQL
jgi:2-polyprenyl-6-methoxyphenol hydroxylase-like FAD-dependent oxidoreductase